LIAEAYAGWGLTEIKQLTRRERQYWLAMLDYRLNRMKKPDG
jgi:hypothetical protein